MNEASQHARKGFILDAQPSQVVGDPLVLETQDLERSLPDHPLTVLLIDSQSTGVNLVEFVLKKLGIHADVVEGALSAIEKIRVNCYDLILMDSSLFGAAIFSALKAINRTISELSLNTKLVLMSFAPDEAQRLIFVPTTCFEYIDKLQLPTELPAVIQACRKDKTKETVIPDLHFINERADFSSYQLLHGKTETDNFLHILIGTMKTSISYLRIALIEKDKDSIDFMATTLVEACKQVGLQRICALSTRISIESRIDDWNELAASLIILEVELAASIMQLEKTAGIGRNLTGDC